LLACAWQGERLAGERGTCRSDRVELVVFAPQPPLSSRCPAQLEDRLATASKKAGKTGAVAAGPLDRPGASSRCVPLGDAKQLAIAAPVRRRRAPSNNSTRRRRHHRYHVLVAVGVDAEHVVQLVRKHQT
jgi:hypothetical protein